MSGLKDLIPLVILFAFIGIGAFIGYNVSFAALGLSYGVSISDHLTGHRSTSGQMEWQTAVGRAWRKGTFRSQKTV